MATFEENIRKIRGEAIYGPEMRTAIADAITQSTHVTAEEVPVHYPDNQNVYISFTRTDTDENDYIMTFVRAQV